MLSPAATSLLSLKNVAAFRAPGTGWNRGLSAVVVLAGLLAGVVSAPSVAWAQQGSAVPLAGHTDPVYSMVLTGDGRWLATGSFDQSIRLWDLKSRETVRTLEGAHTGLVLSLAVTGDGSRIASGGIDRLIRIWDVPTPDPLVTLPAHAAGRGAVAVSRDGKLMVSAGADGLVRLWTLEPAEAEKDAKPQPAAGPQPGAQFQCAGGAVVRVAVRPDGKQVAVADTKGFVHVYSTEDYSLQGAIGAHPGEITGLLYAPNGQTLLTSGADGMVRAFPVQPPATRQIETGHQADITAMELSPNYSFVATASADKTVKLWNYSDGKPRAELTGHSGQVTTIRFSSNSAQVVTGSDDKVARLFDVGSGKLLQEFPPQAGAVTSVALSTNLQELAVGDATGVVTFYKTADASELRKLEGQGGPIRFLAYTPNGQQLLTAGPGKVVKVWKATDGTAVRTVEVESPVVTFQVHPNGTQVAIAGEDHKVRLVSLTDGKLLGTLSGLAGTVTSVSFSRDQQRVAASAKDGTAVVWDLKTLEPAQWFRRHTGAVAGVAFATDSRTLVSAGSDRTVQFDQVSVRMLHRADEKAVRSLAFYSASSLHLTGGSDGAVTMWNTSNGTLSRKFEGLEGDVRAVTFSPDNRQVAAAGKGAMFLWNFSNGQPLFRIETAADVVELAYSPDSSRLLTAAADHVLRNYDPKPLNPQPMVLPSRQPAQETEPHPEAVQSLAFLPDNRLVWTAAADGSLRQWSIAAASFTASLTGHASSVYSLAFHPDGTRLVSASADKTVRLWDLKTNRAIRTLSTQPDVVYSVAYSPDGKTILTGGADHTVRLLDAETGRQLRQFNGPTDDVYSVAFSPDGTRIAAGGVGLGTQRPAWIWNVGSAEPALTLTGHPDDIYRVMFSPDGTRLLTCGYAGAVRVWNAASGAVVLEESARDQTGNRSLVLYSGAWTSDGRSIVLCGSDSRLWLLPVSGQ